MRTIQVTGKGRLTLKPDTTRITLSLEGLHREYGETLRRSAEETEELRSVLSGLGFACTELKTLRFGVDTEYESYRDGDGAFRQRFTGYRFRQEMKLDFPSDNDRLGRVLSGLAKCAGKPEFHISYTVKDPEAAKNALLAKAVADAREKAAALAAAGGVALKGIQSIDYSWGEIDFEVRPMSGGIRADCCAANKLAPDLEPEDMELTDTVTVLWELG